MKNLHSSSEFDKFVEELQLRLVDAVLKSDIIQLKELLDMGVSPDSKTSCMRTAIMAAAERNNSEAIRSLITYGADLNGRDCFGRTPLHVADDPESISLLLKHGGDVNAEDMLGRTPIHYAYDPVVIELLVSHGGILDKRDVNGETPLHHAVSCGEINAIKKLIELGADAQIIDNRGRDIKKIAMESGFEEAIGFFEDGFRQHPAGK